MEKEKHIAILKQLIQQNEKSLSDMKQTVDKLENLRSDSVQRHKLDFSTTPGDSSPSSN